MLFLHIKVFAQLTGQAEYICKHHERFFRLVQTKCVSEQRF